MILFSVLFLGFKIQLFNGKAIGVENLVVAPALNLVFALGTGIIFLTHLSTILFILKNDFAYHYRFIGSLKVTYIKLNQNCYNFMMLQVDLAQQRGETYLYHCDDWVMERRFHH